MKLMTYEAALKAGKEAIDKAVLPMRVKRAQNQAEIARLEIDEKLAAEQIAMQELLASKDIDFDKLLDKMDDVALLERRQTQFAQIMKEVFPKAKASTKA